MKKTVILAILVPAVIAIMAKIPVKKQLKNFHSDAELAIFQQLKWHPNTITGLDTADVPPPHLLPIDSNILFPTAKTCGGCHGFDPQMHALVSNSGEDVNIYDDWRSTMMANSAKDPFWRAKVRHEILVNPSHSVELQTKCTSCHAPAGHYQAKLHDHVNQYLLADLYQDTLGLDGVTCQACHAQSEERIGDLNSGNLNFDTNYIRVAYGPYEMVFAPPMHEFVGITPTFGGHIFDAGLCAGCHTLITNTVDLDGELTGGSFVEQATYHEWLNSDFDEDHDNITCQACHIPQIPDEVIVSANYQFLTPRYPFGLHQLAGANVTMLKLLKENRDKLEISAEPEHFDSTIAATLRMLQQKSIDMSLSTGVLYGDSAHFDVKLTNKAGHKFPSGYPSRRAWIEFEVKNQSGEIVFHSGKVNPDYSLQSEKPNMEPHHNYIGDPAQVQIYEMVPGDVNSNFTNVLERGHKAIKDNRLVPKGFLLSDPVYDTTEIIGSALLDPDFNHSEDGIEGSGSDIVHFAIPLKGYKGLLSVSARVWYQSLPPKWMAPIFEYSGPEIDSFKAMFDNADLAPILVTEQTLADVYVSPVGTVDHGENSLVSISQNVSSNGIIHVMPSANTQIKEITVWSGNGKMVWQSNAVAIVRLPETAGIYFLHIKTNTGTVTRKILRTL
ncbi:MAG: T9SS type A sorting domain-containing protein [Saprospiraceae bacterium]|nr:T9SS type A sorting domain-containing protein [Saprospiraceae bacterium]MCB9342424.1 T9SS type A sorting domain-containing protein [Lewinellaceae bacterium]